MLFCIISPVIGKSVDLESYDIKKYLDMNMITKAESADGSYDKNVQELFRNRITDDMTEKLKDKGYISDNVKIEIDKDCNITKVEIINISKIKDEKTDKTKIDKIEIGVIKDKDDEVKKSEKEKLIDYINDNYGVEKKNIIIN